MAFGVKLLTALVLGAISSTTALAWKCDRDAGQLLYFYVGTNQYNGQYLTRSKKIDTKIEGPTISLICEGADDDQQPLVKHCGDDVGKVQITWFADKRVECHCIPNSATIETTPPPDDDSGSSSSNTRGNSSNTGSSSSDDSSDSTRSSNSDDSRGNNHGNDQETENEGS